MPKFLGQRLAIFLIFAAVGVSAFAIFDSFKKPATEESKGKVVEKTLVFEAGNIGIMDPKSVAAKSKAGSGIEDQLAKINDESKKSLLELENLIKEDEKGRHKSDAKIEDMQAALYDSVRERRYQIAEATDEAISKLREQMKKAAQAVAERKKLIVILDGDLVFFSGRGCVDVTEEVIEELDKICPHIEVPKNGVATNDR